MAEEYYDPQQAEKDMDRLVAQALEAVARGENVDQLLDVMLQMVPGPAREALKRKFAAALTRRKLAVPGKEPADLPSRATLTRLRNIFFASARQAIEHIANLMRAKPDLAKSIREAGAALAKNGVAVDRQILTGADLGSIAPMVGGAVSAPTQQDKPQR